MQDTTETNTGAQIASALGISGDAPAIIVRRYIDELIERQDIIPGRELPGSGLIYIAVDQPHAKAPDGISNKSAFHIEESFAFFALPQNISEKPDFFLENANRMNGFSYIDLKSGMQIQGWKCSSPLNYEYELIGAYKRDEVLDLATIPSLQVMLSMIRLHQSKESPLYGKLLKTDTGHEGAEYLQVYPALREGLNSPRVIGVGVEDKGPGRDTEFQWCRNDLRDVGNTGALGASRACMRPVVALSLKSLMI